MVWLACRKAWILSRLSFSASCTLVVNPPACHPLQAHLVLESHLPFRLILYWTRLTIDIINDCRYDSEVIKTFANKETAEIWRTGKTRGAPPASVTKRKLA